MLLDVLRNSQVSSEIRELLKLQVRIAFFFYAFDNDSKQDASALLWAILFQLSSQLKSRSVLSQLHSSYRNAMPSNQALMSHLAKLFEHLAKYTSSWTRWTKVQETSIGKMSCKF